MPIKLLIVDGDNTLWDTERIRECPHDLRLLKLFPDTMPTLELIREAFRIPVVLVTMGNISIQRQKVRLLELEKVLAEVHYCELKHQKGLAFSRLIAKHGCAPREVMVLGDRVDNEIYYGNELGCITVRMKYGKYSAVEPPVGQQPWFEVGSISELVPIFSSLNT